MKYFGTDGIRGKANEYPMTPSLLLKVGRAVAKYFMNGKKKTKILIGKDTRLSGYMIEYALVSGICSMGADVLLVGPMPTPAIAHLTKSFAADAGIVISASHNPAEDNGIKVFDKNGFKLSLEEEEEIEKLISDDDDNEGATGEKIGKAYRIEDARGRYIEFAKASIKNQSLKGLKVVLDCANGAAYSVAPDILRELGADVVVLNDRPDGLNINKDCGAMQPQLVSDIVKKENADIGISLDGDADRVILTDEKGEIVDGDHILAIIGDFFKERGSLRGGKIVATEYSNMGLDKAMRSKGIYVSRVGCGDRQVVSEMRKNNLVLGGEQSGHIILMYYSTTGDGIISSLVMLRIMKEKAKKLSELSTIMSSYPQLIKNVRVKEKRPIPELKANELVKEINSSLGREGRIFLRYSGTEPLLRIMLEGSNETLIKNHAEKLVDAVKEEIGE